MGFKYLSTRRVNQDPLENFFGSLRSYGIRNVNPTAHSFISSYKSLIVNNFNAHHSIQANCEADDNDVLNSLRCFLKSNVIDSGGSNLELDMSWVKEIEFNNVEDYAILSTHAYISGFIVRQIKKTIGNCSACINQLESTVYTTEHSLIMEREYKGANLIKTRTQFRRMFSMMCQLFHICIRKLIVGKNLKKIYS
ncbi:hypothetical protein ABEB36_000052 [Hypothenemus hampei]|uniref:Transposable element P transposase-like RNase H C-terminal domain-containing protein n=1 Tax=Hypothenemus hampei TaxID=57062 RepID=A0ABD1FD94_HYPHA